MVAPRLDAIPSDYRLSVMPYNSPASLLGLPVTNVPCGFVDGLPVGLSLTGRPGDDDLTLRAAEAFQRATDWHLRSPVDGAPGEVLYTTDTTDVEGGEPLMSVLIKGGRIVTASDDYVGDIYAENGTVTTDRPSRSTSRPTR